LDPILHYLLDGADRGYRPHLLFDPAWYMKARGTRQRDQNPLIDYISYGAREGIDPFPYFATAFYRKAAGGTGGLTPLGHFVAYGLPRGLAPMPLFDRAWYLENNPDVRRAGFDPFLHFAASGDKEGRSPAPLFDSAWKNADARGKGMGPLHHYLAIGAREGRDPSRCFDTEFYVAAHSGRGRRARRRWLFMPSAGARWVAQHPSGSSTTRIPECLFRGTFLAKIDLYTRRDRGALSLIDRRCWRGRRKENRRTETTPNDARHSAGTGYLLRDRRG
jgi:hypothetical protein